MDPQPKDLGQLTEKDKKMMELQSSDNTAISSHEQETEIDNLKAELEGISPEVLRIWDQPIPVGVQLTPEQERDQQIEVRYKELLSEVDKLEPGFSRNYESTLWERSSEKPNDFSPEQMHAIADKATDPETLSRVIKEVEQSQASGGSATRSSGTEFASTFLPNLQRNEQMQELLKGQPLVDLGAGLFAFPSLELANKSEVSHYTAVDANEAVYYPDDTKSLGEDSIYNELYKDLILPDNRQDYSFHRGTDMLAFLSGLPDNYGNFTINGIDSNVINNSEYMQYILYHLSRCVSSEGVVFGANTSFLSQLTKFGFEDVTDEVLEESQSGNFLGLKIFQKKQSS
jgi:hypothetical protein